MKFKRLFFRSIVVIFGALTLLLVMSFIINQRLPAASSQPAELSSLETARILEFNHLRRTVGDGVWAGWGTADIPIVLYNESYAFLTGYDQPPAGWYGVPGGERRGGPWEMVQTADLTYYRQRLEGDVTPQAFTVRIGDRYALSMTTMEWMEIRLTSQFREELPPFLSAVFPYPLVTGLFIRGSEGYISLLAHESFHAYQGMVSAAHLNSAETGNAEAEENYPWDETEEAWQAELDLLAAALLAETEAETADLARQFIQLRADRRVEAGLSRQEVEYERQREWLEGLARYVELAVWLRASEMDYTPSAAVADDPDFSGYGTFDRRWQQEVDQIGRMAGDWGDGRFYYSGMAQAFMLDKLMPGWQARALEDGVFLEGLLMTAVN